MVRSKEGMRQALLLISLFSFTAALLVIAPGTGHGEAIDHAREYEACTAKIKPKPHRALDHAKRWQALGGGDPARHCTALALIALEEYISAAQLLEDIYNRGDSPRALKAQFLAQAARAWMLAGMPSRAERALDFALRIDQKDPQLLVDRAEAFAAQNKYGRAVTDLTSALLLRPTWIDALILRANAYRETKRLSEAERDLDRALELNPLNTLAILELGNLERDKGNKDAAREAWLKVIRYKPNSPEGKAARRNLQDMDAGGKTPGAQKIQKSRSR